MTMAQPNHRDKYDDQPVDATTPENTIDDDVVDKMTRYPPWSTDTNDMCDITQIANDKSKRH